MKRVLLVLGVLGILGVILLVVAVIADDKIRGAAETEAARRLHNALPIEGSPVVSIDSFPFVPRVLLEGSVERLVVSMRSLQSQGVVVDEAKLTVDGLVLDRDQLLEARTLEVVDIQTAHIEAWMTAEALSAVAKIPVTIDDGRVSVSYAGRVYTGSVTVSKHALVVMVEGMPPILSPLPSTDLIPCDPVLDIDGDRIHVACSVDELPPAVARVLSKH